MKSFSQWTIIEVEAEFSLRQIHHSPLLMDWLTRSVSPTDMPQTQLDRLQSLLERRVYDWNEAELTANFIAPLLLLIDFNQTAYQSFMERELSAPYDDETLSGTVDFMVAQGTRRPERPFFFIHEYKDKSGDPLGQLLVTMVAAQLLNQDGHPIYGAYIVGRYWHFVVLTGKSYAVHRGFNATGPELSEIFTVLHNTKQIIEQWVANE